VAEDLEQDMSFVETNGLTSFITEAICFIVM